MRASSLPVYHDPTNFRSLEVHRLWTRLGEIRSVRFVSVSQPGGMGWNGNATGVVEVHRDIQNQILFTEIGTWHTHRGTSLNFFNRYRWTLNLQKHSIQLEHLRYGENQPVKLFDLTFIKPSQWISGKSHQCNADSYSAILRLDNKQLNFDWKITGPRKNEQISYIYQ